ncbi:Sugar transporter TC2A11 family [Acrodontium crateriforme]|uniref:Sugar transporter TC2A11 family n=1 Tax=Acrodontium crateriforme TaxID=150365 RepID=A0AAQ3LXB5_9PEZI|nr:Sugar transporter TC2A11 family [Acrodontium crateriforme]
MEWFKSFLYDKKSQVILFSSTAIALYGYDQGMMSLINTNKNYLSTMGIPEDDPQVGVIVSVYYLGCAVGAVLFSWLADKYGRKPALFGCLAIASLGNLIMFVSGLGYSRGALAVIYLGRVIMGLGVGGVDSVVPVYSSELASDGARGKALAQEFQSNIFGLNMAFAINLIATVTLGKSNEWAWRIPIITMQIYPLSMLLIFERLPESPRWFVYHDRHEDAQKSLEAIMGKEDGKKVLDELAESAKQESGDNVGYFDMFTPGHPQFHPTMITVMGQVNQALTGYGAVSVYGPQIFELLGYPTRTSEYLTQANYISYFILMTFAWILIDAVGRRTLLLWGSAILSICFFLLTLFGGLVMNSNKLRFPDAAAAIPGVITLFIATGAFGIGWLSPVWLIPTEIYPTTARAQGTAISVIIWGLANFTVTLITPLLFNNLKFWLFLVFAATNTFAGVWTWLYTPESGGRSFQENQAFFEAAADQRSWRVSRVKKGFLANFFVAAHERQPTPSYRNSQSIVKMNVFKSLFKEAGVKNVITLFHSPSNPASMRVHTILKQAAAARQAHATEDQASSTGKNPSSSQQDFELDIVVDPPTSDQLNSILEYLGPSHASNVVEGASGSGDALKKFSASKSAFQRPVTVDWNNGRAVAGDNESEILKLLNELPKST